MLGSEHNGQLNLIISISFSLMMIHLVSEGLRKTDETFLNIKLNTTKLLLLKFVSRVKPNLGMIVYW